MEPLGLVVSETLGSSTVDRYARRMKALTVSRPMHHPTEVPAGCRVLFIVSRDLPARYESLAYAFDGDRGAKVIFDRRRAERRQGTEASPLEHRREDRRSPERDEVLRSAGWIRVDGAERDHRPDLALALDAYGPV
jgi:hypothetical protein